ncbi:MAG: ComEC/Rec2 family competence protein [Opitutales bacterium]
MARPDPLDHEDGLKPGRFGHAPALWLALPMLAGCAADAAWDLPAGATLAVATAALLLLWPLFTRVTTAHILMATAGVSVGAAWHQLRKAPRSAAPVTRSYQELSVRIERAAQREAVDAGWTGTGVVTDRDGAYHRRRLAISARGPCPPAGAELRLAGRLASLAGDDGAYAAWARGQGATLRMTGARTLGTLETASAFQAWCAARRAHLDRWLRTLPWEDSVGGSLLAATMLGRTGLIPAEERRAFARTGTLHLFAISGLHIAGMAAAMEWAARRLRLPGLAAGLAGLALLWAYVQVTGAAPSAPRAWIMAACLWAGRALGRGVSPAQSLGCACFITLVLDPEACTDAGFQLSYLAVLGLLLSGGPAARTLGGPTAEETASPPSARGRLQRAASTVRRAVISGLCVSFSASVAGGPLCLAIFGYASWGGVFANLLLVPLSAPPLLLGMASAMASVWEPALPTATWINGAAATWLRTMCWLAERMAELPGLTAEIDGLPAWSGPLWAAMLLAALLSQAEARDPWRLLASPLAAAAVWLALVT